MCKIYLYEGGTLHGEKAYPFIEMAATMYMAAAGFAAPAESGVGGGTAAQGEEKGEGSWDFDIAVTEKGKPYFKNLPLEFSLSNSGDMWACAISEKPCGIDLQIEKENARYNEIAKRFYKPIEFEYVKRFGEQAFFQIWTRHEAYGKMMGEGFWGDIPELVDEELILIEKIGEYNISEVEIDEGIYCALCTADSAPYPIILL